jgi:hypothetical protein
MLRSIKVIRSLVLNKFGGKVKVGVYVDEETWKEVKNLTFKKHGTLRVLSREVNELIKASLPLPALKRGLTLLNISTKRISSDELVKKRPRMETSSVEIIRKMRARP